MIVISDAIENAILAALTGLFFSGILAYFARNRVKNAVLGMINDYILDFLAKIKEHPEIAAEILKPVIDKLIQGFGKGEKGQGIPQMLGQGGIEMMIPFLPRKWQGLAAIGSMFMNKGKKDQEQGSQKNPWG